MAITFRLPAGINEFVFKRGEQRILEKADTVMGRLLLGFLNTCSGHPVLTIGFLAVMLVLACTMWVQMLEIRLDALRSPSPRPIQLRRRVG